MESFVPRVVRDDAQRRSVVAPLSTKGSTKAFLAEETSTFQGAVLFCDLSGFTPLMSHFSSDPSIVRKVLCQYFDALCDVVYSMGGDVIKFAGDALLCSFKTPAGREEGHAETLFRAFLSAVYMAGKLHVVMPSDVQSKLDSLPGGFVLQTKVGLAEGSLWGVHVGSRKRREYLLVGAPLSEMARCESEAGSSDVIVSGSFWKFVSGRAGMLSLTASPLPSGNWRVNYATVPLEELHSSPYRVGQETTESVGRQRSRSATCKILSASLKGDQLVRYHSNLRPYVPRIVLHRLDAHLPVELLGEMRNVNVVFVNLGRLDTSHIEKCSSIIQGVVTTAVKLLKRLDGELRQFLVEDKGATLIAVFGLSAHQDDAARAVMFATELCAAHPDTPELTLRVGVTTGRAFCGTVGSLARCEYACVGNTVNLAARLMVSIDGNSTSGVLREYFDARSDAPRSEDGKFPVLIDERTTTLARQELDDYQHQHFNFTELGEISVKGMSSPIAVFSPTHGHKKTSTASSQTVIGRHDEARTLVRTFDGTVTGAPRGLVVRGLAGCGKSTLLAKFQKELVARERAPKIVHIRCADLSKLVPFDALARALPQWLDLRQLDIGRYSDRLRYLLRVGADEDSEAASESEVLLPLLNLILAGRGELPALPETCASKSLNGPARLEKQREVLQMLLKGRIKECCDGVVVVCEDHHFIDDSSALVLHSLLQDLRETPCKGGCLFVFTSRHVNRESCPPGSRSAHDLFKLAESDSCDQLMLSRLEDKFVGELVEGIVARGSLPSAVIDIVVAKAGGNPFFAHQLARYIVDLISSYEREQGTAFHCSTSTCSTDDAAGGLWLQQRIMEAEASFPSSVESMVLERLDSLNIKESLLLKLASAIQGKFTANLLARLFPSEMHGLDEDVPFEQEEREVRKSLAYLENLGFITSDDRTSALNPSSDEMTLVKAERDFTTYSFVHAVVADVAYASLIPDMRKAAHGMIAEWMAAHTHCKFVVQTPDAGVQPSHRKYSHSEMATISLHSLLAFHWEGAENFGHALKSLKITSHHAYKTFSVREAADLFVKMLKLSDASPTKVATEFEKASWAFAAAESLAMLGLSEQTNAWRMLNQALSYLGEPSVPSAEAIHAHNNKQGTARELFRSLLMIRSRELDIAAGKVLPSEPQPDYNRWMQILQIYKRLFMLTFAQRTIDESARTELGIFCVQQIFRLRPRLGDLPRYLAPVDRLMTLFLAVFRDADPATHSSLWRTRIPSLMLDILRLSATRVKTVISFENIGEESPDEDTIRDAAFSVQGQWTLGLAQARYSCNPEEFAKSTWSAYHIGALAQTLPEEGLDLTQNESNLDLIGITSVILTTLGSVKAARDMQSVYVNDDRVKALRTLQEISMRGRIWLSILSLEGDVLAESARPIAGPASPRELLDAFESGGFADLGLRARPYALLNLRIGVSMWGHLAAIQGGDATTAQTEWDRMISLLEPTPDDKSALSLVFNWGLMLFEIDGCAMVCLATQDAETSRHPTRSVLLPMDAALARFKASVAALWERVRTVPLAMCAAWYAHAWALLLDSRATGSGRSGRTLATRAFQRAARIAKQTNVALIEVKCDAILRVLKRGVGDGPSRQKLDHLFIERGLSPLLHLFFLQFRL